MKVRSSSKTVFELLRDGQLAYSIDESILSKFCKNFHGYDEVIKEVNEIIEERKTKKLIIATHMHAGDGNIHVNIPVHSNRITSYNVCYTKLLRYTRHAPAYRAAQRSRCFL